jgi:hypothetical protein
MVKTLQGFPGPERLLFQSLKKKNPLEVMCTPTCLS